MRRRRLVWTFVIVVAVVFFLGNRFARTYVDLLWFGQLGYASVFWTSLLSRWLLALAGGLVYGVVTFVNLWVARGSLGQIPPEVVPPEYQAWFRQRRLGFLLALAAALVAFVAGLSIGSEWLTVLRFLHATPFGGEPDPVFGRDVGFFVFTRPFELLVYRALTTLFFLDAVIVAAVYFVGGFLNVFAGRLQLHPRARAHLAALVAAFFLLKAWGYVLSAYGLDLSSRGVAFGASYTDVHAMLPALRVLTFAALAVAALALANVFRPLVRPLAYGVGALVALSLALGSLWPWALQEFVVKPNEIVRETPYIKRNIDFTRRAYRLDAIETRDFPADETLTAQDVSVDNPTIANVRLWDWQVLGQAYQQLQGLRSYYSFDEMDIDRYTVDGELRQVLLAAREIDYTKLPVQTWINLHIKYTHGYGAAVSPAARVGPDGFPDYYAKDVPPVASDPTFQITRPEIYFGEQTDPYALVKTREQEFDYPKGETNSYTTYQGKGGIPVGPILNRVAFALAVQNYNVLFSGAITADSRALIYRNIRDRVTRLAPYLSYDQDPYLVIDKGRLLWIQDAYTTTGDFPYSEPTNVTGPVPPGTNYIRNSVKIVIDAYDGDVTFYVADPEDPLIRTYAKIFPKLYRPLSELPPELVAHLRYPEYLFDVQGMAYAKYHMTDPQVFYNSEDQWQPALELLGPEPQPVQAYYAILELPGESQPEFVLLRPYTPLRRTNMVAWLGARSDPGHYGQLIAFLFPKDKNVLGPQQIESTINSTPAIAQQLTLWNQQGSQVLRGNLLVIPIKTSLLYVEPLYLQGTNSPLPRLQRVIVAYDNEVAMQPTLEEALAQIFGEGVGVPPPGGAGGGGTAPPSGETVPDLVAQAEALYDEALDALRNGDFATYGQRIEELGALLDRIATELGLPSEGAPAPPASGTGAPSR